MEEVEKLLKGSVEEMEKLLSAKTVVGEPLIVDGNTVVPLLSVGFGFGAGGGSGKGKRDGHDQEGGGSGTGGGGGVSSGPHHQDSGEAKIRESTAGVSRKPSSDCKACGCSSKHLCGLTAWNT